MSKKFISKNIDDLEDIAKELVDCIDGKEGAKADIVLFNGDMGAGKTTLIRSICDALGVEDVVTSPTFAIVNEYATPANRTIYHFDFYRIESLREVYDLGYEEYFYSNNLSFIEWPSKITSIIDTLKDDLNVATITITQENNKGVRTIEFQFISAQQSI